MLNGDLFSVWVFPVALALHNLEEALWLPGWRAAGGSRLWRRPVSAGEFRFAVAVLTTLALLLAGLTQAAGPASLWHYLLVAYAFAQSLNVLVPHLLLSLATRTYMPGLLTGVSFVWPAAWLLSSRSVGGGQIQLERLLPLAAGFALALLLSIPLLFRIGRRLVGNW